MRAVSIPTPTKFKLDKDELKEIRHYKDNEISTLKPLWIKLGACGGQSSPEFELFMWKEYFGILIQL